MNKFLQVLIAFIVCTTTSPLISQSLSIGPIIGLNVSNFTETPVPKKVIGVSIGKCFH